MSHRIPENPIASDADLAEKSQTICRMGSLMLTSGTGSYRVKAAMGRVSSALGIDQLDAQVSLNEIVVTARVGSAFRTQVVEVPVPTVNAGRINQLMRVSLRARPGVSAADLNEQLDQVEQQGHLYHSWVVVVGAIAACAAFALLNNGRWQECLAAGVAAGLGKLVQIGLRRLHLNHLVMIFGASLVASASYLGMAAGLAWLLPNTVQPLHEAAFTSAILFLIPGFPLVTSALDLARFDFVSGISRFLYATMITLAAALGAWMVALGFGMSTPVAVAPPDLAVGTMVVLRMVASFVGVLGFAMTFDTPLRPALVTALIGMVANVPRLWTMDLGMNPVLATVAATTVVGLLAGWASQRLPCPRIILSVPAVLIMIPGASTYRALMAVIDKDPMSALGNGMASLSMLVALTGGLAAARMLTDPAWTLSSPEWTGMPRTHAQQILSGEPGE